ncbi:MAG: DEAD/DEAH box helicase [Rudaea sp.]|uniref:DEAD/DEAH box helicase n=1 Tax=Rudaea sp. TaxID=2136325 RepID=UPI0039E7010E
MDEIEFRELLSDLIDDALDARTQAKGADYLRRGLVRSLRYGDMGPESGRLKGEVQGSEPRPYTAGIQIEGILADADIDTHCTCPLGGDCKHVAAIALKLLGIRGAQPIVPAEPRPPDLGAWTPWLQTLAQTQAAPVTAARPEDRVFGVLLRLGEGVLPRVQAQPVWLRRGKRGGYVSPQMIGSHHYGPDDPWRGLSAAQFEQVARLRMRVDFNGMAVPVSADDEALLETLIAQHPCFMDKTSGAAIRIGPSQRLQWQWQTLADGSQKLQPRLAGAPAARLVRMHGLWCWDGDAHALSRVEGDVALAEAALRAPVLFPEQAAALRERWPATPRLADLPLPAQPPAAQEHRAAPTPVATLRRVPIRGPFGHYDAGVLRLSFDYAGPRLSFAPMQTRERRMHEGRLFEVVRDRAAELAACERLENLGFVDAELLRHVAGLPRDALGDGDFVIETRRNQLAASEQAFALAQRLRDLGFRLESADGFPFEWIDGAAEWIVEVDDDEPGNPWFDLRLGIDIGGERVDLLPILRRLLADPAFPLAARKGEAPNATWLVPLDERRRATLPLVRLRQLIAPLLEWLQGPTGGEGTLRLRRAQAGVLDELAVPWRGGEALRGLIGQLTGAREPAREPPGFGATLRAYQRDGLAWLGFLADAGLGGVLADDMGLGKTVQVLAHLLAEKQRGRLEKPALILAPTSLVANWRDEAARFAPALSALVLHGPARAGLHDEIARHDLVITTYPLLVRDRERLLAHEYSLLVLDEAQAIKNARTQWARIVRELRARRRLAMSGTPLENHLGELWAQFDAVEPGLLGSEKNFTRFFRTPIEKHADAERRERLQRRIAPLLLRRRKQDVLADLPPKTEIARAIELEGDQRELYETLRLAQHERVLAEVKKRGLAQSGIVVLDALLKLRQACCDPRLVKLDAARGVKASAKLDLLLELLDGLVDEGRRILLFSQFTEMLALIETALAKRAIGHLTLTGQTPGTQRAALVKRFQSGDVPLFLISLKAGGVGLNLTAADTVIHYDPWWNPAVENQATDRAHRIGQDKPVFVYKLICAGTVEEKIQALQQRKAELARAVLEGGDAQNLRFDEADLAELFAPV